MDIVKRLHAQYLQLDQCDPFRDDAMDAINEIEGLREAMKNETAKRDEADKEVGNLLNAVADHVTVRSDYGQQLAAHKAALEKARVALEYCDFIHFDERDEALAAIEKAMK